MAKLKVMEKFNKLPLWGKVAAVAGIGLSAYFVKSKMSGSSSDSSETTSAESEYTGAYPYGLINADSAMDSTGGDSYITNDQFASSLATINDQFASSLVTIMDSMANLSYSTGAAATTTAGDTNNVDLNDGVKIVNAVEGSNSYKLKQYTDGSKEIYKNGKLVPEESYKYIPSVVGGSRVDPKTTSTGSAKVTVNSSSSSANKALQQAQAAYGAAKTTAEKQAAAKAGQAARKAGATDAGAQAVWKSLKK